MFPIPLTSSAKPYNVTAAARSPSTEKSPQMRMKSDDQPEAKTPKQRPKIMRGRKDVEATPQMRNTDSDERIVVAPPEMITGLSPAIYYSFVVSYMMYSAFLLYYMRVP